MLNWVFNKVVINDHVTYTSTNYSGFGGEGTWDGLNFFYEAEEE